MYQIKILNDKDFFNTARSDRRYTNVNRDNLGFADPLKKTAFVRYTAYPDLTKYLVNHEFEHLLEENGTDQDEFGIRHKKKNSFMKFFDTIFNPTTWANPERQSAIAMPLTSKSSPISINQGSSTPSSSSVLDAFGSVNSLSEALPVSKQTPSISSSNYPETGTSEYSSPFGTSLNRGDVNTPSIPPELIERIKGFFSGRIPF